MENLMLPIYGGFFLCVTEFHRKSEIIKNFKDFVRISAGEIGLIFSKTCITLRRILKKLIKINTLIKIFFYLFKFNVNLFFAFRCICFVTDRFHISNVRGN